MIGALGLCNTASINIYEINDYEEKVLAGLNNQKPRWYKLYCTRKGLYFNFGGNRYYLHEFMRV